jgi:hypothetical protein
MEARRKIMAITFSRKAPPPHSSPKLYIIVVKLNTPPSGS